MAFAERTEEYIQRKKAGMVALLQNWAGTLEGYAKTHASWTDRTGHARQGIHAGVEDNDNEIVLYLSHGMEYGGILEEGSPPHIIRPKEKKALFWQGASHPVRAVHHPGSRPHAIIKPTVDSHIDRIKSTIREYWRS